MTISPGFSFHFFEILCFWAVRGKREKIAKKMKNNNYICNVPYISITDWHMIMIFGTLV